MWSDWGSSIFCWAVRKSVIFAPQVAAYTAKKRGMFAESNLRLTQKSTKYQLRE